MDGDIYPSQLIQLTSYVGCHITQTLKSLLTINLWRVLEVMQTSREIYKLLLRSSHLKPKPKHINTKTKAMKTTASFFFFFLFFLLAAFPSRGALTATYEQVYDDQNYPLEKEATYVIVPSGSHEGKRIIVKETDKRRNGRCSVGVSLGPDNSLATTTTALSDIEVSDIVTHTPLQLSFEDELPNAINCTNFNSSDWTWRLKYSIPSASFPVTLGGPSGSPRYLRGSFYLDADASSSESGRSYSLYFCEPDLNCAYVGVGEDERLVLVPRGNEPLRFKFHYHETKSIHTTRTRKVKALLNSL